MNISQITNKYIFPIFGIFGALFSFVPTLGSKINLWNHWDGRLHLFRLFMFSNSIHDQIWLPRWSSFLYGEYGYPTNLYYPPLIYYSLLFTSDIFQRWLSLYDTYQLTLAFAAISICISSGLVGWVIFSDITSAFLVSYIFAFGPYVLQTNVFMSASAPHILGMSLMCWTTFLLCDH